MTRIEQQSVYDDAHVKLQEIVGRLYNNPLGETAFPLLLRLLRGVPTPRVLDAGCGRGQTALWWAARANATVDAFDPSAAMLEEARSAAAKEGVGHRIRFSRADIAGFQGRRDHDLAIVHDVLCYSLRFSEDLDSVLHGLKPGGIASVSSYFADETAPAVEAVLEAWGIGSPESFAAYGRLLERPGVSVLLHADTTAQYRMHWSALRDRLEERRPEAVRIVGEARVSAFANQIDAILRAVSDARYGHWWAVLARE